MSVLSDKTILECIKRGDIVITPLDEDDVQPASVDLHFDQKIKK